MYAHICTSILGHQIQRMGKGLSGCLCQLEVAWINSPLLGSEGWAPNLGVIPLGWWVTRGSSLNSQNEKTRATWLSHFLPFIEKAWTSSSSFKLASLHMWPEAPTKRLQLLWVTLHKRICPQGYKDNHSHMWAKPTYSPCKSLFTVLCHAY